MKNELPFIRPTSPPASPKKNRITSSPRPCTDLPGATQSSVFKAHSTATTAVSASAIQNTVTTSPITTWIAERGDRHHHETRRSALEDGRLTA